MTAAVEHRLSGLEPDNLLAVLALLGLLRALDTVRPEWRARAYWDHQRDPVRPVVRLAAPQLPEDIAAVAAEGVGRLTEAHEFGGREKVDYTRDEARLLWRKLDASDDRSRQALFGALMSDGAIRSDKEDRVAPTPFCFLFGAGHQFFLQRLVAVPRQGVSSKPNKSRSATAQSPESVIEDSLFRGWTRADMTDGFRWDPAEDRRYALRSRDPSGDPSGQQHGANRLGAVALAALLGTAVSRGSGSRFLNVMTAYESDGSIRFSWPLWDAPARLHGIIALLAQPARWSAYPHVTAARISVGKFFNVQQGVLTSMTRHSRGQNNAVS